MNDKAREAQHAAFEAWARAENLESRVDGGLDYPLGRALEKAWTAALQWAASQQAAVAPLPFAVFDEFGKGCEDRVNDHFCAAIAAHQARQAVPQDDWGPIDGAPKDGTRIAIKFASGREHEANWRTTYGGEWHVDSFKHLPWASQHLIVSWRPLAASPQPEASPPAPISGAELGRMMKETSDEMFAEAAHQARQAVPVRIFDYVWPQNEAAKDECVYYCNYSPAAHLANGELLAVVHPSQIPNSYLQRESAAAPTLEAAQPMVVSKQTAHGEMTAHFPPLEATQPTQAHGFGPKLMPQVSGFAQSTQAEAPSGTVYTSVDALFDALEATHTPASQGEREVRMWHDRIKDEHPRSEPEYWPSSLKAKYMEAEILELRAALAAPVQPEPVAHMAPTDEQVEKFMYRMIENGFLPEHPDYDDDMKRARHILESKALEAAGRVQQPEAVAQQERDAIYEECAQIADRVASTCLHPDEIADAIRAARTHAAGITAIERAHGIGTEGGKP